MTSKAIGKWNKKWRNLALAVLGLLVWQTSLCVASKSCRCG